MQFLLLSLISLVSASSLSASRDGSADATIYQDSEGFWTIDPTSEEACVRLSGSNLQNSDDEYVNIQAGYVHTNAGDSADGTIWKFNNGILEATASDQFYLCPANGNRVAWVIHGGQVPVSCINAEKIQIKVSE